MAVSATNNCEYCIDAHAAALSRLGFGDEEITELMAMVDLFNGFNKFLDGARAAFNAGDVDESLRLFTQARQASTQGCGSFIWIEHFPGRVPLDI